MSGEKTEQPTAKKLRDARQKGDVAHSKDFTQTLLVIALLGYLWLNGNSIKEGFGRVVLAPANVMDVEFDHAWPLVFQTLLKEAVDLTLPFLLIALFIGMFAEFLQVGVVIAFEKLKPSGKKLNVIANLKNIFSKKNLVEFLKSCLKISLLFVLVFLVVRDALPELVRLTYSGMAGVEMAVSGLLKVMLINVALGYAVIAIADLAWQRFQFRKGLMMSKHEVKQEYKEMEGDPHIKSKRKHLHQEMSMQSSVAQTRKASVVITNPTHYAVALYYDDDDTPLPVVLAKGEGALAHQMIQAAREEGIPVMRNVPLARALIEQGELDQYIPDSLIEPVAEVLKLVREFAERGEQFDSSEQYDSWEQFDSSQRFD